MDVARLRLGETVALVGALGLFISLFLDWFGVDEAGSRTEALLSTSGWGAFGPVVAAVAVGAIALAVALAAATAARRPVALPVALAVLTTAIGLVALVVLLVRTLVLQPGLDGDLPNDLVTVDAGAIPGLLAAAAIPIGGWLSMADERKDAPYSAPPNLTPRPAPPAA
jgi:hypothetical protein